MMRNNIKYILTSLVIIFTFGCSEDKVSLSERGTITGKVVERGLNMPIENVKVSTNPASSVVFTNAEGNFTITQVPVGSYSVQAQKEGFLAQFEGAEVISDASVNVIFELDVETANNRPPDAPVLVSPADNEIDLDVTVDFIWTATDPDEDTLTYSVELRNDQNNDIELFENITDTTYTLSGLTYGTKYFWQVFATDGINNPTGSTVSTFETLQFPVNRFLYVKNINGNNVIFSSDEDGNELQLTSESTNSWRPRKANNIDKIAFLRTDGGDIHLYTMNLDGSDVRQLTSSIPVAGFNAEELDFSWRSNDSSILYPNFDKLYRISLSGAGVALIHTTSNGNFISEVDWNNDATKIALKTNDVSGYNVEIYTINNSGTTIDTILTGVSGAAGGLDWSVTGQQLLYAYDVSGFEDPSYRQLDTQIFSYDIANSTATSVSFNKPAGTNDLDPRFSPNEAQIICVNTSNDGISQNNIVLIDLANAQREDLFADAKMPDWK